MMRSALALVVVLACGGKQQPTTTVEPPPPVDPRTALEKRRDAGCEQLQPRLTDCAIADAKKTMTPEAYAKLKPEELRAKHKQKFLEECRGSQMSSRQVRVLEVCFKAETECDPLAECLANLKAQPQR